MSGNDKKVVHKMVRRLIKHGTWERHVSEPGWLDSMTCGPVKIERWKASNNVNVDVNGFRLCDSNADYGWGMLAGKAKAFFFLHSKKLFNEHLAAEFSAARLALLRAHPTPPETP